MRAPPPPRAAESLRQQSTGFRRRAASAGYAHGQLLPSRSGYHVALLSSAPIALLDEVDDSEDSEDPPPSGAAGAVGAAWEGVPPWCEGSGAPPPSLARGLLAADSHGVRWMVGHLHAQDATQRRLEAARVHTLAAASHAAGAPPIVLAGDFNTLSPEDAGCYADGGVLAWLQTPAAPHHLPRKFMRAPTAAPGEEEEGGGGGPRLDFRPMLQLLAPLARGGVDALQDAVLHPSDAPIPCGERYTLPTDLDLESRDPDAPGLRIDYVLASPGLRGLYEPAGSRGGPACRVLHSLDDLSPPHLLAGDTVDPDSRAAAAAGLAYAQPDLLLRRLPVPRLSELSDHKPVLCEWVER